MMRNRNSGVHLLSLLLIASQFIGNAQQNNKDMTSANAEVAAIEALENRFITAFNAGDIDAIMKNYLPGQHLIIFDVVSRKQYRGADVYRGFWEEMFSHFSDTPKIAISDLAITAAGDVAFSHSFQHVTGTDKQGKPVDRWVRVTNGYREIEGKWLIAQEHISVPVDFKTGQLVPFSKP